VRSIAPGPRVKLLARQGKTVLEELAVFYRHSRHWPYRPRVRTLARVSMSRRLSPLADYQAIMYGRLWVFTEAPVSDAAHNWHRRFYCSRYLCGF
jgi:hypothetical protein